MSPPQHHHHKNQLAHRPPAPGEGIRLIRKPRANTHTSIRGHNLEHDIKHRERDGIRCELRRFNNRDEKDREDQQPDIVCELRADLLADELLRADPDALRGIDGAGEGAFEVVDCAVFAGGRLG